MNIETTYYSLEWQQALCDKQFAHKNPRQPNVKAINQYGGWHMNPSHVFFSNGECQSLISFRSCSTFSDRIAI